MKKDSRGNMMLGLYNVVIFLYSFVVFVWAIRFGSHGEIGANLWESLREQLVMVEYLPPFGLIILVLVVIIGITLNDLINRIMSWQKQRDVTTLEDSRVLPNKLLFMMEFINIVILISGIGCIIFNS